MGTMKFFAASLLAVAATAVKLSEDEPQLAPELPKCPPKPKEMPELGDLFEMIDSDGSGKIDLGEAAAALGCAVEYGVIDKNDFEDAVAMFEEAAGDDGELDMSEAEAAAEVAEAAMSSGDELAQEVDDVEGGSSGEEEFVPKRKEGPKKGPPPSDASDTSLSGDDDDELAQMPSDWSEIEEFDDELAQKEGEGEKKKPKCPSKEEIEAMSSEEEVFNMID